MIFIETKKYTLNGSKQHLPGFDEQYVNIVDYILKITDEIWKKRSIWVIYDTYEKDIAIHAGAQTIGGVDSVVNSTINTLASFPDRKMNAEAVIWSNFNESHFYSSHRISSTATNLGETDFGEATGKKVVFRTIADCVIKDNKIYEEWLVRDNLGLVQQLGFDPIAMAKKDNRYNGQTSFLNKNRNRTNSMKGDNGMQEAYDLSVPHELILSLFNHVWKTREFDKLATFYNETSTIYAICENNIKGPKELKNYLGDLFNTMSDIHLEVERITTNDLDQGSEVAVRWSITAVHTGEGIFGPASQKAVYILGVSHFIVEDGKIEKEWMVFDAFDVLCQIYANTDKPDASIELNHKKLVVDLFKELNASVVSEQDAIDTFNNYMTPEALLHISRPFEPISGSRQIMSKFWTPLLKSFPDLEIEPYIVMAGEYEGRQSVSCTGNMIGTFRRPWLGIPANDQPTWIRFGAQFTIVENKIAQAWMFLDVIDVMRQAGINIFPNRGIDWIPPAPATGDGIISYPTKQEESKKSVDLVNAMLDGLLSYDRKSLDSMGQERFWDIQNMMWYGPSGIGTTKGLKGFQKNHQGPFLNAFPDRGILPKDESAHFSQTADGDYVCDFGFPAMYASHTGNDWLGFDATDKKVTMRVMDFWRREGNRLKENWVFIDIIDLAEQLGMDVFDEMKKRIE
jgi:predicted ester cyclase